MIDKENYGLGTFSAVEQYDLPLKQVGVARVAHAARYLAAHGVRSVDAIKIDVQGFEMQVLRGLANVLEASRPTVWLELSVDTLAHPETVDELNRLFSYPFEARSIPSRTQNPARAFSTGMTPGDYVIAPI